MRMWHADSMAKLNFITPFVLAGAAATAIAAAPAATADVISTHQAVGTKITTTYFAPTDTNGGGGGCAPGVGCGSGGVPGAPGPS
jgi:hypothetical protein